MLRHSFLILSVLILSVAARAQLRDSVDTQDLSLPTANSLSLRVISPDWLELTRISQEAPPAEGGAHGPHALSAPSTLDGWNEIGAELNSPALLFTGLRVTANGHPLEITDVGWKRRVRYAALNHPGQLVATSLYLKVRRPASEPVFWKPAAGPNEFIAVVDTRGDLIPKADSVGVRAAPLRLSPAIHVNEEGYVPGFPKKAMVGFYLGDLGELDVPDGSPFTVIDARSNQVRFTGRLTPRPESGFHTLPAPYQRVLEADFSAFRIPGEYRLAVPGLGASLPFLIDEGIAMGFARTFALGLYEQRCGDSVELPFSRFTHDACHTAPAQVPVPETNRQFAFTWKTIARYASEGGTAFHQSAPALVNEKAALYPFLRTGKIDVSGGHHDAGDYSKYTENSAQLVHCLLFTVDAVPGAARWDNLGIPESGDGIPDVLQEAKWEADYLTKIQDEDGGFYFLVYPQDREYESNVLPDHGDPQVVWPKSTSVTAAAVAALAECASSPAMRKYYPDAAEKYRACAELGWKFLLSAAARYGKDGSYQKITFYSDDFGPDDEFAWAAAALYAATGNPDYQRQLFSWFPDPADPNTFRWGWWRMAEGWGNAIRDYAFAARTGRLPASALDPRYLAACEGQIEAAGDDALRWSEDSSYATPFPDPTKAVNGGGWYFGLDQGWDMAVASLINPKPEYLDALVSAMNYEGGCNPVNRCYLTGLGVLRQREVVSQYAQNDRRVLPPSGIPIGEVTAGYDSEVRALSYPADDAAYGPYPLYDRWSDVFNVSTEYLAVNQARCFLSAAVLAERTLAASTDWKSLPADIEVPKATVKPGVPLKLTLKLPPGAPGGAPRVVWEARDAQPAYGPWFLDTPQTAGPQWVEAEAEWPDGRRIFAAATFNADSPVIVWFDRTFPPGANAGKKRGAPASDLDEYFFSDSPTALSVGPDDVVYAWVKLDARHPPRELMLAWNDGRSWEHRAYWGANQITYGQNNSPGRKYAGPLPPAGQWVKLAIPASEVDLKNKEVTGMSFSVLGGELTWSKVGREHAH